MKKVISVVGARPNFMKVAPLHRAFQKYAGSIEHLIVHTGQHYDKNMSRVFFDDLELPEPDKYLGVGSGSHAEQTARIMIEFEKVILELKPNLVIVVGDVNSTVACSLVSTKMGVPVAHVEAGLRSFDRSMPEEINRLLTDAVAEYLFVSEPSGVENLRREGIDEGKIHFVGNVMIDSLVFYKEKADRSGALAKYSLEPGKYVLVTLHRPSNVDDVTNVGKILDGLSEIASLRPVVFPVHPRTRKILERSGQRSARSLHKDLHIVEPLGYLDFQNLMMHSQVVLTDSGGIQEETTFLGIRCLTVRKNTERPITVEAGTNELCGTEISVVVEKCKKIIAGERKPGRVPDLWDGKTAERITAIIDSRIRAHGTESAGIKS